MRQRPGCARSRGNGSAGSKAPCTKPLVNIGEQRRFPAEQMRGARDIDQHPVGRIERGPRSPALRPQRKVFKECQIACRIAGTDRQCRAQRAGIGEAHGGAHPGIPRGGVHGFDARAVRGIGDQGERLGIGSFPGRAAFNQSPAIDREIGAPDREDAAGGCGARVHHRAGSILREGDCGRGTAGHARQARPVPAGSTGGG